MLNKPWLASEPYHPYHKWQYVAPESDWDNWYGAHVFHQAPAYSYIIAFFTLVITNPFDVIKTVQLFFGSLSCIFIFLLTRHIAGMFAATIAGVLSAIYAPAFYLEAQILREGLAVFFMLLILFLMIKSLSSKLNNYSISIYSRFVTGYVPNVAPNRAGAYVSHFIYFNWFKINWLQKNSSQNRADYCWFLAWFLTLDVKKY